MKKKPPVRMNLFLFQIQSLFCRVQYIVDSLMFIYNFIVAAKRFTNGSLCVFGGIKETYEREKETAGGL